MLAVAARASGRLEVANGGKDLPEEIARHSDLGQLEGNGACMAHKTRSDLDQPRLQAGERWGGGKPVGDVAGLVDLTTLDRDIGTKGAPDGFAERLGPVDDEKIATFRIKPALDQIVEQGR